MSPVLLYLLVHCNPAFALRGICLQFTPALTIFLGVSISRSCDYHVSITIMLCRNGYDVGHSETTALRQSWVGEHSWAREKWFDNQKVLFGGHKKKPLCLFGVVPHQRDLGSVPWQRSNMWWYVRVPGESLIIISFYSPEPLFRNPCRRLETSSLDVRYPSIRSPSGNRGRGTRRRPKSVSSRRPHNTAGDRLQGM